MKLFVIDDKKWQIIIAALLLIVYLEFLGIHQGLSQSGSPQTVTLYPTKDTYVDGSSSTTPFGSETSLSAQSKEGRLSLEKTRSLIYFGVESSVPVYSEVTAASLSLFVTTSSPLSSTLTLRRVSSDWSENTNWVEQPSFEEVIATTEIAGGFTGWVSWDVSLVVDDWVKRKVPNLGFLIISEETTEVTNGANFYSSNYPDFTLIPKLEISYILEDEKPEIFITQPLNEDSLRGTTYTIRGISQDYPGGSGIKEVRVSTDGGSTWNLASGTTFWEYNWTFPSTDSSYLLIAKAIDWAGNEGLSAETSVSVDNTPPIAVLQSIPGDVVWGRFPIKGTVRYYDSYWLELARDTTPTLWNKIGSLHKDEDIDGVLEQATSLVIPTGTYLLKLSALDKAGNLATDTVNLEVRQTTPPLPPHRNYEADTHMCALCHRAHHSFGESSIYSFMNPLLFVPTRALEPYLTFFQSEVCYYCHEVTSVAGTNLPTRWFFDSYSFHHPIRDVFYSGDESHNLNCSNCHNPHGDKITTSSYYARLLRATFYNSFGRIATVSYRGNDFCGICHGFNDKGYGYALGGDHITSYTAQAAHDINIPTPSSGTEIKCSICHTPHGSDNYRLTTQFEENLCFSCHNTTTSSLKGWNVKEQFNLESHHQVSSSNSETKVECTSCHGPHIVKPTLTAIISDPGNTKNLWPISLSLTEFCLRCHTNNPPQWRATSQTVVPYTISFPLISPTYSPFFPGWNKVFYYQSRHALSYDCNQCHHPHGSYNKRLIATYSSGTNAYNNTTATAEEKLCFSCHRAGGEAGSDIKGEFEEAYTHPIASSGIHLDTENTENLSYSNSKRHSECPDCHNPHRARLTAGIPPSVTGSLIGVGGVRRLGGELVPTASAQNEYEICYKCHSSYTLRPTTPTWQKDKSWEFATSNLSYHPVEGVGKNQSIFPGAFVPPWSVSSLVYCADCHGNQNSFNPAGVHGSANRYILKKSYLKSSTTSDFALCADCHDPDDYYAQADGLTDSNWQHIPTHSIYCGYCHASHGSHQEHLFNRGYITSTQGNYLVTDNSCSGTGCHEVGIWLTTTVP